MMEGSNEANVCGCPHHKMLGIFVVLFGLLFLGGNMGWWGAGVVAWWPVLVILAGAFKLSKGMCKCC